MATERHRLRHDGRMPDRPPAPDESQLRHARNTAQECRRAAAAIADFAERMSAVITPAEIAEYDTLVAREATAISRRVEAFGRLGLGVGSLEATGSAE